MAKTRRPKKPWGVSALHEKWTKHLSNSARPGKHPNRLTKDQYLYIVQLPCFYCGKEPHLKAGNHRFEGCGRPLVNTCDRFYNDKGYTLDNSVPCCLTCNNHKHHSDPWEFYNINFKQLGEI